MLVHLGLYVVRSVDVFRGVRVIASSGFAFLFDILCIQLCDDCLMQTLTSNISKRITALTDFFVGALCAMLAIIVTQISRLKSKLMLPSVCAINTRAKNWYYTNIILYGT